MKNVAFLAVAALAAGLATPSLAATTAKDAPKHPVRTHAATSGAYAQAPQQNKTCWVLTDPGENPNNAFGYFGSCTEPTARPGK